MDVGTDLASVGWSGSGNIRMQKPCQFTDKLKQPTPCNYHAKFMYNKIPRFRLHDSCQFQIYTQNKPEPEVPKRKINRSQKLRFFLNDFTGLQGLV